MDRKVIGAIASVAIAGTIAASVVMAQAAPRSSGGSAVTGLDPANFVAVIDNPYYPLPVGRTLVYKGVRDGRTQIDRITVTDRTRTIQGIAATVVNDVAREPDGTLIEKTTDWFAQDVQGTVWYLGESTVAYNPDGTTDSSGSWEAGVNGAVAGIIMEANPQIPDAYRQEFLAGEAEDTAWIVLRGGSLKVPYGTVNHVLTTLEATAVEPGTYDQKIYAPGLGIVLEKALTSDEFAQLVRVKN